ncbi:MFS transporter [Clostridium malenominatum]
MGINRKKSFLIVFIFGVAYFFTYFHRLSLAVISNNLISDLKITIAGLGILGSAYFYPYAIMQIPCGYITDKYGTRKIVALSLIITAIGSILFSYSVNLWIAFASRILIGLGVACIYVPALNTFYELFGKEKFSFYTGILLSIGILGALASSKPLLLVTNLIGWRNIFFMSGIISAIVALAAWFILVDKKKEKNDTQSIKESFEFSSGLKSLALWFCIYSGIQLSFQSLWAAPFLNSVFGFGSETIGNMLMFFSIGIALGNNLSGLIIKKIGTIKTLFFCALSFSFCWLVLAMLPKESNVISITLFLILTGAIIGGHLTSLYSSVREVAGEGKSGIALGIVNFAGFMGGAIFTQFTGNIIGGLAHLGEVKVYRLLYLCYFIISLLLVILLLRKLQRDI